MGDSLSFFFRFLFSAIETALPLLTIEGAARYRFYLVYAKIETAAAIEQTVISSYRRDCPALISKRNAYSVVSVCFKQTMW